MTDEMPSQAEGERDEEFQAQIPDEPDGRHAQQPGGHPRPHQTPSQAEGDRDEDRT